MLYQSDYPVLEMLLNDVSCDEYRVVYPADGTQFEEQLALHVVSNLEKLTGYRLDIVSDATAYADGYEILIGKTNRSNQAYTATTEAFEGCIAANGKFIALYGNSALGNAVAATMLIDRIQASVTNKKVDLKLSNSEVVRQTEKIAEMTYNIYAGDVSADRSNQVFELILRYLPDVIGIQEGSPDWMLKFDSVFSEYYDRVGTGAFGGLVGSFNSILYSKERFELLETQTKWLSSTPDEVSRVDGSKWIRIFTYALLKGRVTGETICFVNTHLDYGAAKLPQV
jgi:hypothetical protein